MAGVTCYDGDMVSTASIRAALGATAPLAALILPAAMPAAAAHYGVEGPAEQLTVVVLAALCARGALLGSPWLVLPAALLVLEELDWLQPWLGFGTPAWLLALSPRNDAANLHNIPGSDLLWRWLPVVAVCALARRPWPGALEAQARRVALPGMARHAPWTAAAMLPASLALIRLRGERVWDEALELALALWVLDACTGVPDPGGRDPTRAERRDRPGPRPEGPP